MVYAETNELSELCPSFYLSRTLCCALLLSSPEERHKDPVRHHSGRNKWPQKLKLPGPYNHIIKYNSNIFSFGLSFVLMN